MASILWRRDVASSVSGVKETFSSWDNCMSKTYCKWPVIAAIIVVSLIVLSIVFCVARCLCCGAECACCCFRCCASCCPSPSRKKHKRVESPVGGGHTYSAPAINTQYRSHAAPTYEPPQYATFDAPSKPVNEDALPAMPSWGEATSRKVEENNPQQDVELKDLDKDGNAAATVPMLTTPAHSTPIRTPGSTVQSNDGYGFPNNNNNNYQHSNSSYATGINRQPSPLSTQGYQGQESGIYRQDGYHDANANYHDQAPYSDRSPVFPAAAAGGYGGYQQRQPGPGGYRSGGQSPASPYHDQAPYDDQYNNAQPYQLHRTPPPMQRSPQPQQGPYGGGFQQQQNTGYDNGYDQRSNSPHYAPSGSTRYELASNDAYSPPQPNQGPPMHLPQRQQQMSPAGGWHSGPMGPVGRKPVNDSWRDV